MTDLHKNLLVTLLDFAQADVPANVQVLAWELKKTRKEAACALSQLDQAGLVRAEKVRLTLAGLMRATGLRASRHATLDFDECAA